MEELTQADIAKAVSTGMWQWTWGILTWGLILVQCIMIVTHWIHPELIPVKYMHLPLVIAIVPFAVRILGFILGLLLITVAGKPEND